MYWEMMHRKVRDLSCEPNIYVSWSTSEFRVRSVPLNMFKPPVILYWSFQAGASFEDPFCLFMFHICLCYAVLSVPCGLMLTCLERADLLAFLCVMFSCVFLVFPYGVLGQVWYWIVTIPDPSLLLYLTLLPANNKVTYQPVHLHSLICA